MKDERRDAELVTAARYGDHSAFSLLIERYAPMVERVIRRTLYSAWRDTFVFHDLTQEIWLQAYLSLETLREESRFRSWLYGIALNLCRTYIRTQLRGGNQRVLSLDELAGGTHREPVAHFVSPEQIVERLELRHTLESAVGRLSPANREAIVLFYFEGFSVAEASALLGLTENAFKVRLSKARQTLRQMFAAQPTASLHHPHLHPHHNAKHSQMSEEKQMLPIKLVDVIPYQWEMEGQEAHTAHQLVLFDETHHRAIVIWVGSAEGGAIAARLNGQEFPRPMTHVLMARLLEASGAAVESVTISALKEDVYYATVNVRVDGQTQPVDARPSDAIALAVQLGAPLYAAEEVLANQGIVLPTNAAPTGAGLKEIADLTEAQVKAVQAHTEERKAKPSEDYKEMARGVMEKAFDVSLAQ